MAIPCNARKLSLLFYCLLLHTFCSTKLLLAKPDLIDEVCSKTTIDPGFCKTAFHSDPRSSTANLPGLGQIGIDLAQSHPKSAITLVNSLKEHATDPKLKGIYSSCLENYKDSSYYLKDCTAALKEKDYPTLSVRAAAALDGPDTCDGNCSKPPPSEPQQLKQSSKEVQALCDAILAISNMLQGKK